MSRLKQGVSRFTQAGYRNVVKPALFAQSPDRVHAGMVKVAKGVQRIPLVRDVPRIWAYRNDGYLAQKVMGLQFRNPIGLSAGLDKNADMVGVMQAVGFGFMIAGSVTAKQGTGNPKPWFYRLKNSRSLVINAGLPNRGAKLIAKRISRYPDRLFKHFPLTISAAKTNSQQVVSDQEGIADYCETLSIMDGLAQVALHEINISCPNTYGGEPFTTPGRLNSLLTAVDTLKLSKPVIVKMPISLAWKDFKHLLDVIVKHKVAAVNIGNLLKDRAKAKLRDELPKDIKGNLSGLPTQAISTELIRRTYAAYGKKLTIVGTGGVFSAEDAYEKIKAGATLVGMVSGVIFEGPQVIGEINRRLVELLKADGLTNVKDAVGLESGRKSTI